MLTETLFFPGLVLGLTVRFILFTLSNDEHSSSSQELLQFQNLLKINLYCTEVLPSSF